MPLPWLGEEAFDLFIKPKMNDAIRQVVAKDANLTPAEIAAKSAEFEQAIYDAAGLGLDLYAQSQTAKP